MVKEVRKSPILENYIPEEMIWAKTTSHRNEYACGTIFNNIKDMMKNVHDGIMDTLKLNGYNSVEDIEDERFLKFCWLYISIMIEIFCKTGIPYIFREMLKPKVEFKLDRNSNVYVDLTKEDALVSNVEKREKLGTLRDKYDLNKEEKIRKANAINLLRKHVYSNNFMLKGTLLDKDCVTFFDSDINYGVSLITNTQVSENHSFIEVKDVKELEEKIKRVLQIEVKVTLS